MPNRKTSKRPRRGGTQAAMYLIRRTLEAQGPLYVAALYPQDAQNDDEYTPWFVAHVKEEALQPERILQLWELACRRDLIRYGEEMEAFAYFLARRGYLILTSAVLGGFGYLTVDRSDVVEEDEKEASNADDT